MYAKFTVALLAIWLSACSAVPKAEPCGCDPCVVQRCHTIPIHSAVKIHTTHRIIPSNTCSPAAGLGLGYGGLGYAGLGYSGLGYSGLGYSGLGLGYGLGYSGLGYSGLGLGYGLGYSGLGYDCGLGLGYGNLGYGYGDLGLGYAGLGYGYSGIGLGGCNAWC